MRSILDGELVLDDKNEASKWQTSHKEPIFLVFDALVVDGENQMPFNFERRLKNADGYINRRFTKARLMKQESPAQSSFTGAPLPKFELFMKEMFRVQDAYVLFEHILPRLEHENDGLIFTVDAAPYYMGVCPHIWKWKPMHLNTIDFNASPIAELSTMGEVWALYCTQGELFDFIVLTDQAKRDQYAAWRQEKQAECVLECNFDHKLG